MPHDTALAIAHRTTMGHAPENTLAGIRRAIELGCDGVEIDVRLCADGTAVLIHDERLERTTNGAGLIAATPLAALEGIDAGDGERIPTLQQALAAVDGKMLMMVELKVTEGDDVEALCAAVLADIAAAGALDWVWLWSFDSAAVVELARIAPSERRIAHLCFAPTPDIWQLCAAHRLDGIAMHGSQVTAEAAAACRAHGLAAFVWTVNEPADIQRCLEAGVDGIVSDYPERVQAALG